MPQVINTNVPSLNAQRNLTSSQGQLQTSLQRLSSGLRINSAKDDAAGLAIAERFTTQIRGTEIQQTVVRSARRPRRNIRRGPPVAAPKWPTWRANSMTPEFVGHIAPWTSRRLLDDS